MLNVNVIIYLWGFQWYSRRVRRSYNCNTYK